MGDLDLDGDGATTAHRRLEGMLPSGGRYVIDVPVTWRGVLLVYSIGYIVGSPGQQPRNAADGVTVL